MRNINSKIAKIFWEMADIFELKKVRWKPQAYRMAAQTIESLKKPVSEIYKKEGEKGLDNLSGIGSGISRKIIQYIESGKVKEHEKLKKSIPSGLYHMMNIPGIGVKKSSLFYHKLGIRNIRELKKAAKEHKLRDLPGFKEKAEKNILRGIQIYERQRSRISLDKAEKIAGRILSQIKKIKSVKKAVIAGSLRRRKTTIGDIDIVIETSNPKQVADKFVKMNFVKKVLGKGKEKASIITDEGMQVDIRLFSRENFGAGLLYFTGDKQHNIWLRKKAMKKGWKLNEYGLFELKTGKKIAGKTEKGIYDKLKVKFLSPEMRIGKISGRDK